MPQAHGGALNSGGTPGNRGGGRQPTAWKEQCARVLRDAKALRVLREMIAGDIQEQLGSDRKGQPIVGQTKNSDRLGAITFLAKYAHGVPGTGAQGQVETPDGYKFTLMLGERDGDRDGDG